MKKHLYNKTNALPTANCPLGIANCQLPIALYILLIANCILPITSSAQNTFRYEICQETGPLPQWDGLSDATNFRQVPSDSGYFSFTSARLRTSTYLPDDPYTWSNFSTTKLDQYGNWEWTKVYPEKSTGQDFRNKIPHDGIPTADGGFIIAGEKYTDPYQCCTHTGANTCVQKTDKDGHLLWTKLYPISSLNWASKIRQMPDSGFIVMGHTKDNVYSARGGIYPESYNTYLLRLDKNGNKTWCYYYDAGKNGEESPLSLDVTDDGGFIVGGWTTTESSLFNQETLFSGQKGFMMKVSGDGITVEWARRYGEVFTDFPRSEDIFYETKQTPDGGYISVGQTEPRGEDTKGWVVKTNALGKIEWQKNYDTWTAIYNVEVVNEGYILGSTEYDGDGSGYGRLTKIGLTGEVEWSKLYDESINSTNLTLDGGLVVTQTRPISYNRFDRDKQPATIMKTNLLGEFENGCFYTGALSYREDARIDTSYTLKPVTVNFSVTELTLDEVDITEIQTCPVVCGISKKPMHQGFPVFFHGESDSVVGIACVGVDISITINQDFGSYKSNFSHYKIDFGDPLSGSKNSITGSSQSEYEQVAHMYSYPGIYIVTIVVYNGDYTQSDTGYTKVVVIPRPKITLLTPEIYVCTSDTVTLAARIEATAPNQFYSVWGNWPDILSYGVNANVPVEDSVYVSEVTVLAGSASDGSASEYYTITLVDSYNSQCGGESDTVWVHKGENKAIITGDTKICKGGSSLLTAKGGDTYLWNTGATTGTITVSPVSNRTYRVEATTMDGCRDTTYIYVQVVPDINVKILAENKAVCLGDTVRLYASGAPNYTWSNGSVGDTIQVIPARGKNTYVVTGSSGSCKDTASVQVSADPLPIVSISGLPVPVAYTCIGSSYTLTASGGERYYWLNSIVNNPEHTFLQYGFEGTFFVKAYNGGCGVSAEIEIRTYISPGVIGIEAEKCRVCPGTEVTLRTYYNYITFDQNPNDNPENQNLSYRWSTGQINAGTNDSIKLTANSDTTITLITTNGNGCSVTHSTRIQATPHFSFRKEVAPISSCDRSPTTIYLMGEPLSDMGYNWGNGIKQDTLVVSPLQDSMLYVTVTANGCTRTDSVLVKARPNLPQATISGDALVCKGVASSYTASGNATSIAYQWLSDNSVNPTMTIAPVKNTTIKAVVTFTGGCKDTAEYNISVVDIPQALITGDTLVCPGGMTLLQASGRYDYQWSTGSSANNINVTALTDTPISMYAFAGNCSDTASITIKTNQTINATLFTDEDSSCAGIPLTLMAGGGDHYFWNTGDVNETLGISPAITTTYTVVVTTNDNCKDTQIITIVVKPLPTAVITGPSKVCDGDSLTLSASGGGNYVWNTGEQTSFLTINKPSTDGNYWVVVSVGSCEDTAKTNVSIVSKPLIDAGTNVSINYGNSIALFATGTGSYQWSPVAGLSCTDCASPLSSPATSTLYYITLKDANGCKSTDSVLVFIDLPCGDVFVPTAFSPNNDGNNDMLFVRGRCIQSMNFIVYDRWGEKVFEVANLTKGWDGTYNDKPMNSAVFVYSMEVTLTNGEVVSRKGNIVLTR